MVHDTGDHGAPGRFCHRQPQEPRDADSGLGSYRFRR
jgi:hypothetical protein